ncbi:MAG: aminotransferase class I/II-fold pyridoxal phosphate-dependent enzyme [bacterium]|nr:aminotransferase class I/II-fold pyridoxal phosphate-dependent enzyme [bacterium]
MTTHELNALLETTCPRLGQGRGDGEPLVAPIVQSTTFCRDGLDSDPEHKYSRESNPTVALLERALGTLEDAPPAVCYGTGLAAESGLFLTLLRAGDHVVCSRALYGGTTRLLERIFFGLGVATTFVDSTDVGEVERALEPNTKLVFLETPANPTLDLTDIRAVSALAKRAGAWVAVDNTFLTAVLQRPLDLGADFSVYSTTKSIEGHSVALGGAIVARDEEQLEALRFTRKCTGNIQSPFNAWLTLQGIKTLPLRLGRQCESAQRIVNWLVEHPATARVNYPTAPGFAQAELASVQHLGAHGAVVSFELEGGAERARAVSEHVTLCRLVEHVGSVETLLTHSASMTHGGVPRDQRELVGVTEGLLRLSVGLEHPDAIIHDLERAFRKTAAREEVTACPVSV